MLRFVRGLWCNEHEKLKYMWCKVLQTCNIRYRKSHKYKGCLEAGICHLYPSVCDCHKDDALSVRTQTHPWNPTIDTCDMPDEILVLLPCLEGCNSGQVCLPNHFTSVQSENCGGNTVQEAYNMCLHQAPPFEFQRFLNIFHEEIN